MAKMFEYAQLDTMRSLNDDQQRFMANVIVRDVKKIAKEKGISEEDAYFGYIHGLYGSDREV